ncbi:MAG: AzlC family ABC transporter permease [Roseivivax sp.]|nr:AzlC family ABC transporter permease [Roseivivax sp.]
MRDALPFLVVVIPFAVLFGVVATEAGLNVYEALAFSVAVIAGAAQFTALQLMMDDAPTWVALASALAVNLRLAMYSASITPHIGAAPRWQRVLAAYFLVDQVFALTQLEYERRTMPIAEKMAYFFGVVIPICVPWYLATLAGAMVGKAIPESLGLDFVLPIAFLAMLGPLLRTPAHIVAALAGIVVALSFAWLPYNLSLMAGGLAGMMAGAQAELWLERRKEGKA